LHTNWAKLAAVVGGDSLGMDDSDP
jgi:hypothetical protein